MPKPFTQAQRELLARLAASRGQTVGIQTSQYDYSSRGTPLYSPEWKPVAYAHGSTVRGLAARGIITIADSFWRGFRVSVPATLAVPD